MITKQRINIIVYVFSILFLVFSGCKMTDDLSSDSISGSITGRLKLDNKNTGNFGFLVCVAGTSYMAISTDDGTFTINDVPAGDGYLVIIMKGNYNEFWSDTPLSVTGGKTSTLYPDPKILNSANVNGQNSEITIGENGNWFINGIDTGIKVPTISFADIQGVAPVTEATPATTIEETPQYTGTVEWKPDHPVFAQGTEYTATITLTAKAGYTLQGVEANFFTVDGVTASNDENSGVIYVVFPTAANFVKFNSLAANGWKADTVTKFTFTFNRSFGLTKGDISLTPEGIETGSLTNTGAGIYELAVSKFPPFDEGGHIQITATVTMNDYTISPDTRTIYLYETIPERPILISQIYGGGGNSGALYKNDYIVLHNDNYKPMSLNGWSIQYAAAAGTHYSCALLSGEIAAGGYFLIQLTSNGSNGISLPVPDIIPTNQIDMATSAGKVALVMSTNILTSSSILLNPDLSDFVGYGSTANQYNGHGPTAAPSNTMAIHRKDDGRLNTGENANDFEVGTPAPQNSNSPPLFPENIGY